jgi:hypothetical protein
VDEHDGITGAGLGDVEAQPAGIDHAMRDALELRQLHQMVVESAI